ncbi:DNA-binding protein [Archaeoglobales archaeon]|nr:MAG: DNA-binding protein [Archaeoglobales archaeon]
MVVIDTNIAIERVKNKEEIRENIAEVTLVEYPPITDYEKFYGRVLIIERVDVLLAIELQKRLRRSGKTKPFADILIASICINRNEELITKDKDFLDIDRVSNLKVKLV